MIGKHTGAPKKHSMQRLVAHIVLAAALLCGLVGGMTPSAKAASNMDYYLNKAVEWGVMRGDINGNLNANRRITRAEFVTMVNRAYGYTKMGENPFKDVNSKHWFYEDVCIARKIGYFQGVTSTIASPYSNLTREQAAVIIGRNMMLEQGSGEALGFTDSRLFGDWSRHMIEAVAKEGIITGYANGSFQPKQYVTRGQVAAMLVRAIGTPVQKSGEQSLGGVYGNLTITAPGVTLKNTTVYGNLYISGGVDLSNVVLENVKVTGKIVVCGTGESQKGEHSVILRNVTANELVLDSIANQFVTLKAEGLTDIGKVNVRTGAYLEDVTEENLGLKGITLDGKKDTLFQLAGNIKDVIVISPKAKVTLAQGVAQNITVDEKAVGTTLQIAEKAIANVINLDAGTTVTGTGSIAHMNVNTAGSSSTILPDTIVIRPGVTAVIKGEEMDTAAAQESSEDPRLLSGYPKAKNIAPKSAELAFKTNKKGTVYWAVTALSDGTVNAEELIHPPVYSGKILLKGTVSATASNTELMTKISGLTTDGSYYVSAILVDNRGMRSPVKINAFTTPDDTVPAFASGYPYTLIADGLDQEQIIQAMVMPNKNCQMYYALLPKGSNAPTPADFKANAVTGNLGYGIVELQKNTPYLVSKVNVVHLKEETDYDLYLWLTDADGTKSSSVKKVPVRTLDRTPPKLQHLTVTDVATKSVTLTYALNEPGTLYWAVVKSGTTFYAPGITDPNSSEAMAQIESGINALVKGSSTASKGLTDVKFTISGLQPQTAYDVYYVAKDKAGNYGVYDMDTIKLPYTIYTLDNEPPTVKQEFTNDGTSDEKHPTPYPDTSISLVFSENVQGMKDRNQDGRPDYEVFLELYNSYQNQEITVDQWAEVLREYIKLYEKDSKDPVKERTKDNENDADWVIDYRKVTVEMDKSGSGELIMTFPYNTDLKKSALNLSGGVTYQFKLEGIADTSTAANYMEGHRGITELPEFTTISAQIMLAKSATTGTNIDMPFSAKPLSNHTMPNSVLYDLVVWSDKAITFKLYKYNGADWEPIGNSDAAISYADGKWVGVSTSNVFKQGKFDPLNQLEDTIYGIQITSINGDPNRNNWNQPITLQVTAVSGSETSLPEMSKRLGGSQTYEELMNSELDIADITIPLNFSMTYTFLDTTAPRFDTGYPTFAPGDSSVRVRVSLDRPNAYYYYVVAPLNEISTTLEDGAYLDSNTWETLPKDGSEPEKHVTTPTSNRIMTFQPNSMIKAGSGRYDSSVETIQLTGLQPKTKYVAYFVLRGEAQSSYTAIPYCFRFETGDVDTPIISLLDSSPEVGVKTSTDAYVDWILISSNMANSQAILNAPFYGYIGLNDHDQAGADLAAKQQEFQKRYPTDYQKVRVLDVLSTNVGDNETMSVFDRYAGKDIYNQMLTVIRESTGTSYLTDRGSNLPTEAGTYQNVAPKGMTGVTQYYFIAAARHINGSRYGFKGVPNIHMVDSAPPDVKTVNTILDSAKDSTGQPVSFADAVKNPGLYKYSGKVSISFSKTPYHVYYDDASGKNVAEPMTDTKLKNLIGGHNSIITKATVTGQTIEIEFDGAQSTTSFLFFKSGWIGDVYGNMHTKQLELKFNAPFVNPTEMLPEFEWKWN